MQSYRVTDYYQELAEKFTILKKQFMPDTREEVVISYETSDPLDENRHMVTPGLIHRYKDRVLFLVTDSCLLYCRHCFRRDFIDRGGSQLNDEDIVEAAEYIKNHSEIHEVILSGGDPLTLNPEKLEHILKTLAVRENIVFRIGTRVPIVDPGFIDERLFEIFKGYNLWLNLQCNHPAELTEEVRGVLRKFSLSGVHLINQSVLLKDINDSVEVLRDLSHRLLDFGVKPYYIFQGDLAEGTSHLRVPIKHGLELIRQLRYEVSGLAMPTYAVDIPDGGGKIPLTKDYIIGEDEENYWLTNNEGYTGKYPKE